MLLLIVHFFVGCRFHLVCLHIETDVYTNANTCMCDTNSLTHTHTHAHTCIAFDTKGERWFRNWVHIYIRLTNILTDFHAVCECLLLLIPFIFALLSAFHIMVSISYIPWIRIFSQSESVCGGDGGLYLKFEYASKNTIFRNSFHQFETFFSLFLVLLMCSLFYLSFSFSPYAYYVSGFAMCAMHSFSIKCISMRLHCCVCVCMNSMHVCDRHMVPYKA